MELLRREDVVLAVVDMQERLLQAFPEESRAVLLARAESPAIGLPRARADTQSPRRDLLAACFPPSNPSLSGLGLALCTVL